MKRFMLKKQLIDDYLPEVVYYDDTVAPFYPTFNDGIELTTYYYNKMYALNHGKQEVVACSKVLNEEQRKGMVRDIECGVLTITAPEAEPALKISLCYEVEFKQ